MSATATSLRHAADAVATADGTRLLIRPLGPADGDALAAAVAALSPRSRYLRFMSPKPALTRREVAALTDLDHHHREALVAVEPHTGRWVAVARYAAFGDEPWAADVAITVCDEWQGRGAGSALLGVLVGRAAGEGFARLRATTLAANDAALRLLRRHGFAVTGQDGGVVDLELPLAPAVAQAA
jgi:RimJ/RimL family protein N-acetyltransferase